MMMMMMMMMIEKFKREWKRDREDEYFGFCRGKEREKSEKEEMWGKKSGRMCESLIIRKREKLEVGGGK